MKDVGILVLGHGSTLPYNRELVEEMARLISLNHPGATSEPAKTTVINIKYMHFKCEPLLICIIPSAFGHPIFQQYGDNL